MAALRRLLVVPGVLLLVAAVVFAGLPVRNELAKNHQVSNADSVEATVLSTNVTQRTDSGGRGPGSDETYWSVRVRYRYTVGDTTYESSAVTPLGTSDGGTNLRTDTKSEAESFLDDYAENATVTAYYPADEPSNAFLKKETTPLAALAIPVGFGLILALVGAVMVGFGVGVLTFPRR